MRDGDTMRKSSTVVSLSNCVSNQCAQHHHNRFNRSASSQSFVSMTGSVNARRQDHEMQLALINGNVDLNQYSPGVDECSVHNEIVTPTALLHDILSSRRPSAIVAVMRGGPMERHHPHPHRPRMLSSLHELAGSSNSLHEQIPMEATTPPNPGQESKNHQCNASRSHKNAQTRYNDEVKLANYKQQNRRIGDDALSSSLSALYAKLLVILGIAMPVTQVITKLIPMNVYHGFYIYLYMTSIAFVVFLYISQMRLRAVELVIKTIHQSNGEYPIKRRAPHFGSFYLRVGAISFGIGSMVYSLLEFGQYVETIYTADCSTNFFNALTPITRMVLSCVQMQFIFLNTTELDMAKHKVVARFGLMHIVATNLCEWLHVLVEETKHEIPHFSGLAGNKNFSVDDSTIATTTSLPVSTLEPLNFTTALPADIAIPYDCARKNIMGSLVQNAAPFLFPCTIEYSLICAVIAYEMWKKVKSLPDIERSRRNSQAHHLAVKKAHHFSVDCSRAHRGMFAGIIVIVFTIICLIMYFVLYDKPDFQYVATFEVTLCESILYSVTTLAVLAAVVKMRDLKYQQRLNDKHSSSVQLDCTLLVLAQTGVYLYALFSIIASYFTLAESGGGPAGMISEILNLLQTSVQTLFILNASWRRCKGAEQHRIKPGREIVTFLLVANMSMWFIYTLIKGRAAFRPTHIGLYGPWAWTVITHVSMPLAIFYRFHSTICLFEIWKSAYKMKSGH